MQYSIKLYTEVVEALDEIAKASGIKTTNVVRHIINEYLDKLELEKEKE